MKAFYYKLLIISAFVTAPFCVQAQVDYNETGGEDSAIAIFGTSCEPYNNGVARSSARIKASDKASFNAVENIAELAAYRQAFSAHDFNVLVYYLVDNFLEDLAVKTTYQDQEKLCVEVSGYLGRESILKAFNENFDKFGSAVSNQMEEKIVRQDEQEAESDEPLVLMTENSAQVSAALNGLPPKPQPTFKAEMIEDAPEDIEAEDNPDAPVVDRTAGERTQEEAPVNIVINNDKNFSVTKNGVEVERNYQPYDEQDKNIYVYIPDTEFFNDTTSGDYYDLLKNIVLSRSEIKVTTAPEEADYILKSKILKAKVDPINSKTNRLHLIAALELKDIAVNDTITEHQNRFILFESNENEQTVAADLMEKMLRKAGDVILNNITYHRRGRMQHKDNSAIITPSNSKYGTGRQS